jgi:hypothetical protein
VGVSVAGCANCGAARRTDGLTFCSACGLPYPAEGAAASIARRPPVVTHPWFILIVAIALAGVVLLLLSRDVTVRLGTTTVGGRPLALGLWIVACSLYWAPTLIAIARRRMTVRTVALVNLLFGWTVIGWIVAFWLGSGGRTYEQVQGPQTDSARSP